MPDAAPDLGAGSGTGRGSNPGGDASVDVVVVGSGHNGLVAACYLARAGLSVEVVESDDILGGAVSTVERWPGVHVDRGSSAHVIIRHSGIVEELALAGHGLRYIDCDPWGFAPAPSPGAPGPAGRPLVFSVDLDATCTSIAAACGAEDAVAYHRFPGDSRPFAILGARLPLPSPAPRPDPA